MSVGNVVGKLEVSSNGVPLGKYEGAEIGFSGGISDGNGDDELEKLVLGESLGS